MGTIANVNIGVCSITFNGVDLGHTAGGVEVNYTPDHVDLVVDQYGETPFDKSLLKEELTAKVPLAENTLANLKVAIPSGELTGNKLTIGRNAGYMLSNEAKLLVLHPIRNDAADLSEDITMYSAVVISEIMIPLKVDEQTVIEATFLALINENHSNKDYLGVVGDTT